MIRKLFVFSCLVNSFCTPFSNGKDKARLELNELRPPKKNAAPLELFLPSGVKPQLEAMSDFSGYKCVIDNVTMEEPLATMTIYIGQRPPRLSGLVNTNKFFEEVVHFHGERAAWFSWIAGEGEKQRHWAVAYLYNIYTTQPNREIPYMIQVIIEGRDMKAINSFKVAAQTIRAKQVNVPQKKQTANTRARHVPRANLKTICADLELLGARPCNISLYGRYFPRFLIVSNAFLLTDLHNCGRCELNLRICHLNEKYL